MQYNKKEELKKIAEAKKKGTIYISPMIYGDNAKVIQSILINTINNRSKKQCKQ
jgi:hypothetical protein